MMLDAGNAVGILMGNADISNADHHGFLIKPLYTPGSFSHGKVELTNYNANGDVVYFQRCTALASSLVRLSSTIFQR